MREPSFPASKRYKRIAAGTAVIVLMVQHSYHKSYLKDFEYVFFLPLQIKLQISMVLISIVAVIIYRILVSIPLFQNETLRPMAQG